MKYAFIVAAALAGVAYAQDQCLATAAQIPQCGTSCLTAAGSSYGCAYTDFACQCSHQSQINNQALTSCVLAACTDSSTALMVSSSAEALCSCVSAGSGGSAQNKAAGTTTANVPATTAAMGGVTGGSAASPTSQAGSSKAGSSSIKMSLFTGGAAYAAGSVGGVMAGVLGLVAAL